MQLEYATGAQLLNYPDAACAEGLAPRPEVAAAMPAVSDGGRTYTFRVRPGFRFSPPSNEAVTAETFKYSIERALSPGLGPRGPGYDVHQGHRRRGGLPRRARRSTISGIAVRGDRLRIRLVAPAGDFLARLSMPYFAAVPIGTPIVSGGVQTPIPSAGPYYIKLAWQGELLVLERQPELHGPRPHTLRAHRLRHRQRTPRRTTDRIGDCGLRGRCSAGVGIRRRKRAGRTASAGEAEQREHAAARTDAAAGSSYLAQHCARRLRRWRLRRAVNYAIDRRSSRRRARRRAERGTCRRLCGASDATRVSALAERDASAALLRGFHGQVVLYTCTGPGLLCDGADRRCEPGGARDPCEDRAVRRSLEEALKPGAAYDILLTDLVLGLGRPSSS